MKTYGMMLADTGPSLFVSGAPHALWDNNDLRALEQIQGTEFEAVDMSSVVMY